MPTKRGAHLALSLERLEQIASRPLQRIGLSATQRPLDEVARFLGGVQRRGDDDSRNHDGATTHKAAKSNAEGAEGYGRESPEAIASRRGSGGELP